MEEIIVAAYRLKELSEEDMTPLTRRRMKELTAEIDSLLGAA